MKKTGYMDRAMKSRDPRFASILGKLGYQRRDMVAPKADPHLAPDDMSDLRKEYEAAAGKRPYHGWDAATLREKIAAGTQAQKISEQSASFFANQSRPGGILAAPGKISDETAKRLKELFETGYSGGNAGRIAVIGDGLKFEQMTVTADDSQLVEQLKWTAETIATSYGVPLYKVGLGPMPTANNTQGLNIEYYSQALQGLIEDAESCLDEGLGMDGVTTGVEFDVDGLWRMDSLTQMDVIEKAKSVLTLDERRARLDRPAITGGATVYLQQQDHSLEVIAARDKLLIEQANAPKPKLPSASGTPEEPDDIEPDLPDEAGKALFAAEFRRAMAA